MVSGSSSQAACKATNNRGAQRLNVSDSLDLLCRTSGKELSTVSSHHGPAPYHDVGLTKMIETGVYTDEEVSAFAVDCTDGVLIEQSGQASSRAPPLYLTPGPSDLIRVLFTGGCLCPGSV